MNKNTTFNLSIAGLFLLTLCAIPLVYTEGRNDSCDASASLATAVASAETRVTAAVSTDTLSAVSGIEKPLMIELVNQGDQAFADGTVVITVSREDRKGDSASLVPVARHVAQQGASLDPQSVKEFSYIWSIPSGLKTGVYVIDADLYQGGVRIEDGAVRSSDPFGNSAKLYIVGDSSSGDPVATSRIEDLVSADVERGTPCGSDGLVYWWAAVIGALGVVMICAAILRKRSQPAIPYQ